MNEVEKIVHYIRVREVACNKTWPGDIHKRPVTRYPNLAAEMQAAEYFLWCPAEHANVSEEVLASILEGGDALHAEEAFSLARLFQCKVTYLIAPTLQMIDPATHKGKRCLNRLNEYGNAFYDDFASNPKLEDPSYRKWIGFAFLTDKQLCNGQRVTYAAYRRSLINLQEVRHFLTQPKARKERKGYYEG